LCKLFDPNPLKAKLAPDFLVSESASEISGQAANRQQQSLQNPIAHLKRHKAISLFTL